MNEWICLSCPQITECNSLSDKHIQSKYWPNRRPNSAEAEKGMSIWRVCLWKENCKTFFNAAVTWTVCPPNVKLELYRSVWGALRRQTVTAWLLDCFACYTSHTQLFVRPLDPRNYDNLFFTHFVLTYDFSLTIFIMLQLLWIRKRSLVCNYRHLLRTSQHKMKGCGYFLF